MRKFTGYEPKGVIPACLLPFKTDLSIDEAPYRKHLRDVAAVPGITALTINAHASEVASCTFEEQRRVLDITVDEVGDDVPLVHGVYADGSLEAARIARMADQGGASCLLVFPPNPFLLGGQSRPEMALTHFSGSRTRPTCRSSVSSIRSPAGRAIRSTRWCGWRKRSRRCARSRIGATIRCWPTSRSSVLHALSRPVNVLSTHSAWLFPSLVLGCDGLLSGSGSVIADLHVALWEAVQADDLPKAREIHDRVMATVEVFYASPVVDMHNRMKEALVILGRIPSAVVRPPLVKPTAQEIEKIRRALERAGIGRDGMAEAA